MFDIDNILANKEIFLENINDGGNREDILRIYAQPKGVSDTELSKSFSEIAEAMMAGKLVAVQGFGFDTGFVGCNDGIVTGFSADSSNGYSVLVLADKYLNTFEADSPSEKPVLDPSATVDLSAGSGGGGGVLVVGYNDGETALDHTWKEIHDAGYSVFKDSFGNFLPLMYMSGQEGDYLVAYWSFVDSEGKPFATDSENGYPAPFGGGGDNPGQ